MEDRSGEKSYSVNKSVKFLGQFAPVKWQDGMFAEQFHLFQEFFKHSVSKRDTGFNAARSTN